TDEVHEFAIKMLTEYEDKEFRSVSSGDMAIDTEEESKKAKEEEDEHKDMYAEMKELRSGKVSDVKVAKELKADPGGLSTDGEISVEMEKVLNAMPNNQKIKAYKVLEINIDHDVYHSLKAAYDKDEGTFKLYTNLLYNQALLIEGLPVSDPVEFTND